MAHTIVYRLAQGQVGSRPAAGGILLDAPHFSVGNPAAAGDAIPVAAMPYEVPIWIAPQVSRQDANVSTLLDAEPSDQAVRYTVQEIRVALAAVFAAAANSFNILIRRFTSGGVLVGTVATLFNGVTDTSVAEAMISKVGAALGNAQINPGDVITVQVTANGAGAACPPFGGILDIQG